jgi:hypothetical protein
VLIDFAILIQEPSGRSDGDTMRMHVSKLVNQRQSGFFCGFMSLLVTWEMLFLRKRFHSHSARRNFFGLLLLFFWGVCFSQFFFGFFIGA